MRTRREPPHQAPVRKQHTGREEAGRANYLGARGGFSLASLVGDERMIARQRADSQRSPASEVEDADAVAEGKFDRFGADIIGRRFRSNGISSKLDSTGRRIRVDGGL